MVFCSASILWEANSVSFWKDLIQRSSVCRWKIWNPFSEYVWLLCQMKGQKFYLLQIIWFTYCNFLWKEMLEFKLSEWFLSGEMRLQYWESWNCMIYKLLDIPVPGLSCDCDWNKRSSDKANFFLLSHLKKLQTTSRLDGSKSCQVQNIHPTCYCCRICWVIYM